MEVFNDSFESNHTYNFSGASLPFDHLHIRVIFIIIYALVFALCIFGNLMVLFAIVKSARLRSMTNFFLANLAVADFCVGVFCVLPNLMIKLSPQWRLGRVMCKVYYFVWNMCYTASIVILTAIAAERYIAIKYPLKARRCFTLKKLVIAQAIIWTISGLYNVPYLIVFDLFPQHGTIQYCFYNFGIMDMKAFTTVNFVMWYSLPLLAMTFLYSKIARVLWRVGSDQPIVRKRPAEQPEETHSHCTSSSSGSECHYTIKLHKYPARGRLSCGDLDSNNSHDGCRNHQGAVNGIVVRSKFPGCRKKESNGSCFCVDKLDEENSFESQRGESSDVPLSSSPRPNIDIQLEFTCCRHPTIERMIYREAISGERPCGNNCAYDKAHSVRFRPHLNGAPARINSTRALHSRRKVIRLLVAVVVSFAICVLPHHIRLLLKYWGVSTNNISLVSPISFLILFLNSALNPILYALFSANFRKSFKEIIPCKKRSSPSTAALFQDTKFGSF